MTTQLKFFETESKPNANPDKLLTPETYKGLLAFHKYWGKKPLEPLAFLIEKLSPPNGLVLDPFLGSGTTGVEAVRLKRRFIGVDINPIAVKLSSLLISPPKAAQVTLAFQKLEQSVKTQIMASYKNSHFDAPATHYLWESTKLIEVRVSRLGGKRSFKPNDEDIALHEAYENYQPHSIRAPHFFDNSRINSKPQLSLHDIFTGRALRNIELILDAISQMPTVHQMALKLTLTSSLGQMSNMVFAITGRGKTTGEISDKVEVGSWVIGFWRPKLHFEINVWNCFENRAKKLINALDEIQDVEKPNEGTIQEVLEDDAQYALLNDDTLNALEKYPNESIDLILTDPPHSDRAPYLELSELWNSCLGFNVDFSKEIIVSNARERGKNISDYNARMKTFVQLASSKLKKRGAIVVLFNASDDLSWQFLSDFELFTKNSSLKFMGHFPIMYSARSVVQDNRKGSLKHDFAMVYSAMPSVHLPILETIPRWSAETPSPSESC